MVHRIRPAIQKYAWGTHEFIPNVLGFPETGEPHAEAWYGTHPNGPAALEDGRPLSDIAGHLPYLVKILSIANPLSIQVHPNLEQAQAGYTEGNINYQDPLAKPETFIALEGGLEARVGVKPDHVMDEVITALGSRELLTEWRSSGRSSATFLQRLLKSSSNSRLKAESIVASAHEGAFGVLFPDELKWLKATQELHPQDVGVLVQLALNYLYLEPGEAVHLRPGQVHAYLKGNGVEVMGASDNVLRAGLTPKHMDIPELLKVASLEPELPPVSSPDEQTGDYGASRNEYSVSKLGVGRCCAGKFGSIVLSVDGVSIEGATWQRNSSAYFVEADSTAQIDAVSSSVFVIS